MNDSYFITGFKVTIVLALSPHIPSVLKVADADAVWRMYVIKGYVAEHFFVSIKFVNYALS